MDREFFTFSPIKALRPLFKWPGGARIALWVVPNIEHYAKYLPGPVRVRNPWPRSCRIPTFSATRCASTATALASGACST